MANTRHGNIHYVDTTGTLTSKLEDKVAYVVVTTTSATAVAVLSDTSDVDLLKVQEPTSGVTRFFDFSRAPIAFGLKGLKAKTLTNCVLTIIYTAGGGGSD